MFLFSYSWVDLEEKATSANTSSVTRKRSTYSWLSSLIRLDSCWVMLSTRWPAHSRCARDTWALTLRTSECSSALWAQLAEPASAKVTRSPSILSQHEDWGCALTVCCLPRGWMLRHPNLQAGPDQKVLRISFILSVNPSFVCLPASILGEKGLGQVSKRTHAQNLIPTPPKAL